MKKKVVILVVLIIFIVIATAVIFQKYSNKYLNSSKNISGIKLSLIHYSNADVYIFKEIENIEMLLQLSEELETFKSEPELNMPYSDINFEITYNNGKKVNKIYEQIKPYPDILSDILDSVEARKQSIPLLYEDTSKIDKLTLKSPYPKMNSIEITDKEVVDEIINGLKEYYLSDKAINDKPLSRFMDVEVEMGILGFYQIYFDNDRLLNLLKDMKIYDDLAITVDDIKDMTLSKGNTSLKIKDKEIIDLVMQKGYDGMNQTEVHIQATLNTPDEAKIYGCFRKNEVPEKIEMLFE